MQRQLPPPLSHVIFRTHHEFHRSRKYLEMDVEADVEYGDGTPEWLIEAMRCAPRDSWGPQYDCWHAVRQSWGLLSDVDA
jgi:hypothetical protein